MEEVIIIGAGPCGLSAAVELQRKQFNPLVIEKHCMAYSIYRYPTNLQFFSSPELLEIGGIPFSTPNDKPYRQEALVYYRNVASHENIRIHSYEEVVSIVKKDYGFDLHTIKRGRKKGVYQAKNVVVSTGYFDYPSMLGIPEEELDKVTHYYEEAHPYTGMKVTIIGGNNSAVDAALDLLKAGAEVTVVYRGSELSSNIKPWVKPIYESMLNKGSIHMLFESCVTRIEEATVIVRSPQGEVQIANDFVLALTGFRPDRTMLAEAGVDLDEEGFIPVYNPQTMETNVKGLYIAGVIASGKNANEVFIETGRLHGKYIVNHLSGGDG
ncbi:YpdA family putative bacillithiol disulfide reductase [Paenibacillus larvae]